MRVQKRNEGEKKGQKEREKKMKERADSRDRPEGVCHGFYAAKINATCREEQGKKQREDA